MNFQAYIEGLLELPEVKALMRRAMLDLFIYGSVMPETIEQQARLLEDMKNNTRHVLASMKEPA